MKPCRKRQKVVKRPSNETRFRCLHKQSAMNGQEVNEDICASCPVRVFLENAPCKKPAPTSERVDLSNVEVKQMIEDAGLKEEEFDDRPLVNSSSEPPNYPPMSMQLWAYKEALLKWQKAGRPTRSQEEVDRIHEQYCSKCDWYDKEKKRCKGCGCKVTSSSMAVFNKIKMATEHCPKGLW